MIAVLPLLHLFVDTPGLGQGVPEQPSVYFQADNITSSTQHLKTCRQALEDRAGIAKDQRREAIRARAASSTPTPSPSGKGSPLLTSTPVVLSEADVLRQREQGADIPALSEPHTCRKFFAYFVFSQRPLPFSLRILKQTRARRHPAPSRF